MLIDYQNIHLSVADYIAPRGTPPRQTLIHPLKFSEEVVRARSLAHHDPSAQTAELASVRVFRGVPSQREQSNLYAAAQAQRAEWTKDRRVQVDYRTLRYEGKRPREKGVDVRVAIEFVWLAMRREYDVLVLASHDSDMEPAIEMGHAIGTCSIETAGWVGGRRLNVPGRATWHTALDGTNCFAARDRRDYWSQT